LLHHLIQIKINTEWSEIRGYGHIRNCIIHHMGELPNDTQKRDRITNLCSTNNYLEIDDSTLKIINEKYIYHLIDIIDSFFKKIIDEYK